MNSENRKFFARLKKYAGAVAGVVLITALLLPFRSYLNPTSVSLSLLLVVLFVATVYGSRPAFLSSILGILCFNYFFLPPFHTFDIAEWENWLAFGAFLITALTAGQLSGYARRRTEEAERLYSELQIAFKQASEAEALRQSEKLKSALLDAVTHDLRTPLTSIKASVTTLLEILNENKDDEEKIKLDDEEINEFLEIINEETDRLNQFIENIVGLAKIEANALHLRKTRSGVEEIINNAIERAKNQLENFQVTIDLPDELPEIFADAHSIAEVVYTLLDNAVKYSPDTKEIRISAREISGETVEISVEDKGRGVAPEIRDKIFDKFFRQNQDDIHTTSGGIGLGLAIAKGIVESQGGKIRIEDGGDEFRTKFVFQIPSAIDNSK